VLEAITEGRQEEKIWWLLNMASLRVQSVGSNCSESFRNSERSQSHAAHKGNVAWVRADFFKTEPPGSVQARQDSVGQNLFPTRQTLIFLTEAVVNRSQMYSRGFVFVVFVCQLLQ
jgi:hypothetical protein